jgi:RNA polymerase sigma-70 factor (ECF subfamily)
VKSLGGLSTAQTARAFLVSEPTMAARLLRARRKIAKARIPFEVPPDELLDERLRGVLAVVYVVFTEGHTASDGDELSRPDLCAEAIRLGRLLVQLMPDDAEAHGLLALMLLTDARRDARTRPDGEPVDLRDQDRALWDAERIAEGCAALRRSLRLRVEAGPYALQAGIAALHDRAASFADTDWARIVQLYDALLRRQATPVVALNRAVAVSFAEGPERGLELLDELRGLRPLRAYVPLLAARADLLRRAGDAPAADAAYAEAIACSANAAQRADLEERRRRAAGDAA